MDINSKTSKKTERLRANIAFGFKLLFKIQHCPNFKGRNRIDFLYLY